MSPSEGRMFGGEATYCLRRQVYFSPVFGNMFFFFFCYVSILSTSWKLYSLKKVKNENF